MTRETINNEDRGVSLKSVKHILYEVCLHYRHKEIFGKLLERVDELRDWEEYMAIKKQSSGDLISRAEAIKAIDEKAKRIKNEDTLNGLAGAVGILFDLPSVNPQEPTGYWIENAPEYQNIDPPYICSECGNFHLRKTNYCDQCGARMVEPQERSE